MRRSIISVVAIGIACSLVSVSSAVTHTWNGGNSFGPTSMNNALNWSGGAPVSGSSNLTLVFPAGPSNAGPNQNIANPLELQSMSINDFYGFTGSGFRFKNLGAAPTLINNGGFATIPNAINFFDPTVITTNNNGLTFSGALTGGLATFNSSNTTNNLVTVNGGASNNIAMVVNPYVQLDLQKANAVASSLSLTGGTMSTFTPGVFAPGTNLTVNSPTVALPLTNFNYMNPAIRMTAPQTVNALTLNSGQIDIQTTFLTLTAPINATGTSALVGIGGMVNAGIDLNGVNGYLIQTPGAADRLIADCGIINGSFTKTGAGTLELNNTFSVGSVFTGQNVISAGKIITSSEPALGTNTLNNATLEITGGSYTGLISGSGNVIINGFAAYAALNTYTGGTSVNGQLSGEAQYFHGNITGTPGSTLNVAHTTNQTLNAVLSGSLGISKSGAGVTLLPNTNTSTGDTTVYDGGLKFAANNALGTGQLLTSQPTVTISLEAVGTVSLVNSLFIGSPINVIGSGNLNFTSTNAKNTNYALTHNSIGNTSLAGKFTLGAPGSIVVNAGGLSLGDASAVGGFIAAGPITVNTGGSLTLKSLNFISLPDVTLAGGTLNTPNGYAIPLGAALQGNGAVTGRVASANGSTIIATGNLSIGDAAHPAGVNLDGELYTNANTVTLQDANQSVLGSLTRVGTVSANGTLNAPTGLVVNFGRNVTGRGQIQSINNLANAVIVNGDVSGDSFTNYIDFTGYVKGVGTFNNVAFSGTFSPGLSPALLTAGNIILTPSNVLDIELGGLLRGSQYDAFDINGVMALNGQLKLTLINAFNPSLGNQFDLINGTTTGTFSSFNFPALSPGLFWDTSLLYSQGIVQVVNVPEPTTLASLSLVGTMFGRRRRR